MGKKIAIGFIVAILVLMAYASTKPDTFRYERSGVINSSPEKIFIYLNSFKMGSAWSPYEKKDPQMKKTYTGPDTGAGSGMQWVGNSDAGEGSLEMIKEVPNSLVQIRLTMLKPIYAENLIEYTLTPEGSGTKFTWAMSGKQIFLTKLLSVFINCENMVTGDFDKGIQNLKTIVESHN